MRTQKTKKKISNYKRNELTGNVERKNEFNVSNNIKFSSHNEKTNYSDFQNNFEKLDTIESTMVDGYDEITFKRSFEDVNDANSMFPLIVAKTLQDVLIVENRDDTHTKVREEKLNTFNEKETSKIENTTNFKIDSKVDKSLDDLINELDEDEAQDRQKFETSDVEDIEDILNTIEPVTEITEGEEALEDLLMMVDAEENYMEETDEKNGGRISNISGMIMETSLETETMNELIRLIDNDNDIVIVKSKACTKNINTLNSTFGDEEVAMKELNDFDSQDKESQVKNSNVSVTREYTREGDDEETESYNKSMKENDLRIDRNSFEEETIEVILNILNEDKEEVTDPANDAEIEESLETLVVMLDKDEETVQEKMKAPTNSAEEIEQSLKIVVNITDEEENVQERIKGHSFEETLAENQVKFITFPYSRIFKVIDVLLPNYTKGYNKIFKNDLRIFKEDEATITKENSTLQEEESLENLVRLIDEKDVTEKGLNTSNKILKETIIVNKEKKSVEDLVRLLDENNFSNEKSDTVMLDKDEENVQEKMKVSSTSAEEIEQSLKIVVNITDEEENVQERIEGHSFEETLAENQVKFITFPYSRIFKVIDVLLPNYTKGYNKIFKNDLRIFKEDEATITKENSTLQEEESLENLVRLIDEKDVTEKGLNTSNKILKETIIVNKEKKSVEDLVRLLDENNFSNEKSDTVMLDKDEENVQEKMKVSSTSAEEIEQSLKIVVNITDEEENVQERIEGHSFEETLAENQVKFITFPYSRIFKVIDVLLPNYTKGYNKIFKNGLRIFKEDEATITKENSTLQEEESLENLVRLIDEKDVTEKALNTSNKILKETIIAKKENKSIEDLVRLLDENNFSNEKTDTVSKDSKNGTIIGNEDKLEDLVRILDTNTWSENSKKVVNTVKKDSPEDLIRIVESHKHFSNERYSFSTTEEVDTTEVSEEI